MGVGPSRASLTRTRTVRAEVGRSAPAGNGLGVPGPEKWGDTGRLGRFGPTTARTIAPKSRNQLRGWQAIACVGNQCTLLPAWLPRKDGRRRELESDIYPPGCFRRDHLERGVRFRKRMCAMNGNQSHSGSSDLALALRRLGDAEEVAETRLLSSRVPEQSTSGAVVNIDRGMSF